MLATNTQRIFLFLLMMMLLVSALPGNAESGSVEMVTAAQHGGEVHYPQLQGFANAFVQDAINQAIMNEGGIQSHLNAMAAFTEAMPGNLMVTSTAQILKSASGHDLLSVLVEARGNLAFGPPSHRYTPLVFSLVTGQRVACDQVLVSCEEARSGIEAMLEDSLGNELSNYLDASEFYPFPIERFLLTETGISFFYPEKGMVWLSGKSAFIHFLYSELSQWLDLAEGAPLIGLDLWARQTPTGTTRTAIESAASSGALPGLPVAVGDLVNAMLEAYPLLHDPEGFVSGQKYQLEDDRFRGSLVLSLDGQTVSGLLSRRMNLFGLSTGKTSLDEIKSILGEPAGSISLSAEAAQLYGVPAGIMMEYTFPNAALKLFLDENQALSAVWLDRM